jgi:predicted amidohydrolase
MRLTVVQMNSGADVAANLQQLDGLLKQAVEAGAELAVLPENFALLGADPAGRIAVAEDDGAGPVQDAVAELARQTGMWLVAGTLAIKSADPHRPSAACCVYNSAGERVGRYDKMHLFDVRIPVAGEAYAESAVTLPGDKPLVIATPWGRLGIAVCYDLRFPEQFRAMAAEGLDLLLLPAAFTVPTGRAHWEVLLRARAIENLCYVAAAAQTGEHPGGRATWGHSMIVDPWGEVLADAGVAVGIATADLDRQRLERLRNEFPVLQHRRFD